MGTSFQVGSYKVNFHKSLILAFTRRILYFMSVILIILFMSLFAEADWPIVAITVLVFVIFETYNYDSNKPFIPPIITYKKV